MGNFLLTCIGLKAFQHTVTATYSTSPHMIHNVEGRADNHSSIKHKFVRITYNLSLWFTFLMLARIYEQYIFIFCM